MHRSIHHMHQQPLHRVARIVQHLAPSNLSGSDSASSSSPLDAERARATFPLQTLTHYLDGGAAFTAIKEMVQSSIGGDDVLNDANGRFDLTRDEARRRCMAKIAQVTQMVRGRSEDAEEEEKANAGKPKDATTTATTTAEQPPGDDQRVSRAGAGRAFEDAFYNTLGSLDPSWAIRIGVHYGLFHGAVTGSGTDEQRLEYEKDIQAMRIIGCFAMTEMGHGSDTNSLETTATYDRTTREFIINTPTIKATKWWIGGAAHTATHAAVFARLIIDGQSYGIQTFIVPLRSLTTGETLPHISLGDIGPKMGRNGLDNGWIRFDHVRVPHKAMLQRWSKVDAATGRFTPPPSRQIAYNSLIGTRVELIKYCSEELKKALTITIRYACVRTQFVSKYDAKKETTLMDYPTHQARLLPILAHAYVLHFTARNIQNTMERSFKDLEKNLKELPQLHATSSGMKSIGTWYTHGALECARQSLGGMGYSSYAVLPSMIADYAVMCSWEGDNTVLSLQCAKYLLKEYGKLKHSKGGATVDKPSGVISYFHSIKLDERVLNITNVMLLDSDFQLRLFQHRAKRCIHNLSEQIDAEIRSNQGLTYDQAFERVSVECLNATRLHVYTFMLTSMQDAARQADKAIQPILKSLCDLFALHDLHTNLADLLVDSFFPAASVPLLSHSVRTLLLSLRRECVPLVDAFALPDFLVDSPLGKADGDIYNNMFEAVKSASGAQGVPPYFQEFIRPLTDPNYKAPTPAQ